MDTESTQHPGLALIVAVAENGIIGREGDLPWRLSSDLQRFKSLTMGHALIMGRRTFESIGRLLPGRTTVIVTRQPDYQFPGALIAHSLSEALTLTADDDCPFLVGGAELYRIGLPLATRLFLTRVHAEVEGDVSFPDVDWEDWHEVSRESFAADERNEFAGTFSEWVRRSAPAGAPDRGTHRAD